ncbi:hypothetical protein LPJ74_002888, partial [Coemansia sp. RSA 1843]
PKKCEFFKGSAEFLDYVITKDGLVIVVVLSDCSRIAMPLINLMVTKEFVWNGEAESAFSELKERLSSAPIIRQFDLKRAICAEIPPFYFGPELLNGI